MKVMSHDFLSEVIEEVLITHRLKTLGKDNFGHFYTPVLFLRKTFPENAPEDVKINWILQYEGTSGRWYVSTLLKRVTGEKNFLTEEISIDFGQGWTMVNHSEVMKEVISLI